jgi:RNA polymerase sigma-70 factor, ECF subfamily
MMIVTSALRTRPQLRPRLANVTERGTSAGIWETRVVARLCAGDESALAEVYDQYASFVYGLAHRIAASPALAEEITQEVFVHIWQHADRIDLGVGSVRAYLGVLAHRRSVDAVRSEQSRRTREAREATRAPLAPPDLTEATTALAEAKLVREALDILPAGQREVVMLVYLDGMSYRDAASALGIPEGTAKSRGRLALAKLAVALEAKGVKQWT